MPKFLPKRKKKSAEKEKKEKKATKSRSKAGGASPLMADDSHSSKSSSSRLKKKDDGARDAEKKEREERRKARDKKFNDKKDASAKKKEKKNASKKPKLSREEQDAKDSKLGCWTKTQQILVKIVHVIDALIGLTFVIYGSLISTEFKNPATEAVITTLTFGSTMLFTSIMGIIGFYSGMCERCGLALSAYTAPFIAFTYLLLIVLLLASPGTVFDYLNTHKDVMYLNTAEILTLRQILPFFYTALASLAAIEIIRFIVLRNLRHTLVRYDAASQRILSSASSKKSSSKSSRSKRSNRSDDSDNLTEPLVSRDEEEGKVDSDDY